MKFDTIIGNPPYNNDLYVDFVLLGVTLYDAYICMITPTKWQSKNGGNNEDFRSFVVPYMRDIIFYPDCQDVFNICEPDGISIYLIDKDVHAEKRIVNICNRQQHFNGIQIRGIEYCVNNVINGIAKKVVNSNFKPVLINPDRAYWVQSNIDLTSERCNKDDVPVYGGKSDGSRLLYGYCSRDQIKKHVDDIDKYKVILHFKQGKGGFLIDSNGLAYGLKAPNIYMPGEITKDGYMCLFASYNLNEVQSCKSYFSTKFIRFLIFGGCSGDNASNYETWRFVPKPDSYDHIYTDKELYTKYNLTEDEIEVIEGVLKYRSSCKSHLLG